MRILGAFLLVAILVPAAYFLALPTADVVSGPQHRHGPVCSSVAKAIRHTARNEADADYWLAIANCLNTPGSNLWLCRWEAWKERREALDLAKEQYEARLELCEVLGGGRYYPVVRPGDFSPDVTNSYSPYVPGRVLIYEKNTPEGLERVTVTTMKETIEIEGVECRVVRDVVTVGGEVEEDTVDWFAQHRNGDVWYFGEISENYEDGLLDNLDGSWRYGKDSALPGIIMPTVLKVDQVYRQEYLPNEAEDVARIVALNQTVKVKAGVFHKCLQSEEWTPLEPDAREWKYYAPGIGLVLEVDIETRERLELVKIIEP